MPQKAAAMAKATILERMTKPQNEGGTFAAEREVETEGGAAGGAEAYAGAVTRLELRPLDRANAGRNLTRVDEDRAAHERIDLVAVFGLQRDQIPIAEAERGIAASDVETTVGR